MVKVYYNPGNDLLYFLYPDNTLTCIDDDPDDELVSVWHHTDEGFEHHFEYLGSI